MEDLEFIERFAALEEQVRRLTDALGFVMESATATVRPSANKFAITPPPPEVITLAELYHRVRQQGLKVERNSGAPRLVQG